MARYIDAVCRLCRSRGREIVFKRHKMLYRKMPGGKKGVSARTARRKIAGLNYPTTACS